MRDDETGFDLPLGWETIDRRHWLYMLLSTPYLKIGIAGDLERRLSDYRLHNPHQLRVVYKRRIPRALAIQIERRVHAAVAKYAIGREWFAVEPSTAIAAAKPVVKDGFIAARKIKDRSFGSTDGKLRDLIEKAIELANA